MEQKLKDKYGLFDTVDEVFKFIVSNPQDQKGKNSIQWVAHYMEPIYEYAKECDSIVEMGINQCNTTWAFLKAKPKDGLISIDINIKGLGGTPQYKDENIWLYWAKQLAEEEKVPFSVVEASTLEVSIPEVDLLFIDTEHTYDQLSGELSLHGNKSKKYIILHDTTLFPMLNHAVNEFLNGNPHWKVKEKLSDKPGLTVLSRT